jgi:hypothetical protein
MAARTRLPRAALTRMAVEDIGLADPRALQMAVEAWDTYDRLGSPKAISRSRRSRSIWRRHPIRTPRTSPTTKARSDVEATGTLDVPMHIRKAPTKLMKQLGYGKGYQVRPRRGRRHRARSNRFPRCDGRARVLRADRSRARWPHEGETRRAARRAFESARSDPESTTPDAPRARQPARTVWLLGAISLVNDAASDMIYPLVPLYLASGADGRAEGAGLIEGVAEAASSLLKLVAGVLPIACGASSRSS